MDNDGTHKLGAIGAVQQSCVSIAHVYSKIASTAFSGCYV